MWLGIAGFAVIVVLMGRHVNGAIMAGILFTTFISWIPGHAASFLGPTSDIPGGVERMAEFRHVRLCVLCVHISQSVCCACIRAACHNESVCAPLTLQSSVPPVHFICVITQRV